jgi:hypothetical protein
MQLEWWSPPERMQRERNDVPSTPYFANDGLGEEERENAKRNGGASISSTNKGKRRNIREFYDPMMSIEGTHHNTLPERPDGRQDC